MTDKAHYTLTSAQAELLGLAVALPQDKRREILSRFMYAQGSQALLELMVQFMGLANSVAANCRELAEELLISEGGVHPHTAEKVNMPTIFGAIAGVRLANSVTEKGLCAGCAYRLGTVANQCEPTATDAIWCAVEDSPFMCHERVDDACKPVNRCAGHAQAVKHLRSAA